MFQKMLKATLLMANLEMTIHEVALTTRDYRTV